MSIEEAQASGSPEGTAAPAPTVDVDAASIAAARGALGTTPTEVPSTPDQQDDAASVPAIATAPAPALTELEQLRREVKSREVEQQTRDRLEAQYGKRLEDQVAAEREKIRTEIRAEERAAVRKSLRENPYGAINELEVDGASLVQQLAARAAGGPLHDEMSKLKAKLAEIESGGATKSIRAELDELKAAASRRSEAEAAAARQDTERQLVTMVTEKSPESIAFFGGAPMVVRRAQEIADEYCAAKKVATCPYGVVVQQLESEAKAGAAEELKRLDARRDSLSKLLQQPAGSTGKPAEPNGQRNVSRTLNAQGASERRASPKPVSEMTPAEQDEAMRTAAREAMGPPKKSRMG